ncbi:MDR/SDR family oxidoreductase [Streptomyces noursei]|nr:MDR/SDR family oxidoreductase [Streptomyces noursei]
MLALGVYPEAAHMGTEGAGVVVETGSEVTGLAAGDEVMGLLEGGFGPLAVADHRLLARIPRGWRATEAATVPIAYATAHYALHDLAGVRAGQSVLIHAAAGGVGMAAIRLARAAGAEVFATASPGKHETLRGLGLDDDHIASSREPGFGAKFRAATGGRGVDVVLNSLTGELLDESADLLTSGGVFVELGKTDLRRPEQFDGRYRPFDLAEAGPDRLGEILAAAAATAEPLPVTAWRLEHAPAALAHMSRAQHIGKLVLTLPVPPDPDGTVLVTGGTGTLGRLLARHLVTGHGVRNLLLVSRQGAAAPGTRELTAELSGLGAKVTIATCDVADREALAALLAGIPEDRPLTGVVHAAGVLGDGLVTSIDADLVDRVFAPKVDAAWHLHELTADKQLSFFALFSSGASVLAGPGQGTYAAANAVLDALAGHRYAQGLSATALGWGLWAEASGMTGALSERDRERMARQGMAPLPTERALALFDLALLRGEPVVFRSRWSSLRCGRRLTRPRCYAAGCARHCAGPTVARRPGGAWPTAWPGCPPRNRRPPCRRWCARMRPRSPDTTALTRCPPRAPSAISASTRSPRWNCATGWAGRPGCACPARWSSTTPHHRRWPSICAANSSPRRSRPSSTGWKAWRWRWPTWQPVGRARPSSETARTSRSGWKSCWAGGTACAASRTSARSTRSAMKNCSVCSTGGSARQRGLDERGEGHYRGQAAPVPPAHGRRTGHRDRPVTRVGGTGRRVHRDRRHGVPVPRRGRFARQPVGTARRRR